jgi:lipopolysaccharide assembly outer membrane protein LptD (OstA)
MISCPAFAIDLGLGNKSGFQQFRDIKADDWSIVGDNIVVKGNVYIPYGNYTVYADKAIVNFKTKDLEAVGNIRIYQLMKQQTSITLDKLAELSSYPQATVNILGYSIYPDGEQRANVEVIYRGNMFKARKVTGNLSTGYFQFIDFNARYTTFSMKAKSGTRSPGGKITIKDGEMSSCSYLENKNEHYSVKCSSATLSPQQTTGFGLSGGNPDFGDHSIWAKNCSYNVYGIPVLWLPAFYKPKDESLGLVNFQGGYNTFWGAFFLFSKKYKLSDSPYSAVKLMADYYTLRGFGYGADVDIVTDFSKTRILGYGLYDMKPYGTVDDPTTRRLTIPHARYNVRINNVTHLTPRLDFRGQFQLLSDYYFLYDFFKNQYNNNPEPSTYGAFEYQFDRFTASIFARAQTNDFFNTVEELPTFRLNFPRQELFKDIYWEGETSLGYYNMKWREFDRPRTRGNMVDPKNYQSLRFDTVNMFYYNLKFKDISIIPRAGVRLTYYNRSSKQSVTSKDVKALCAVSAPEGNSTATVVNYDAKGGSKVRFIGEFGVEATGKISRSWLNVRNSYWRLDGLRHIIEPYANYTYIPEPSVSRDNLFFFDEIDRIDKQNFIRVGVRNRLQTRRGNYGSEEIYSWFSMENYWDYHFEATNNLGNVGDFATKIYFQPSEKVSLISFFSVNASGKDSIPKASTEGGKSSVIDWLNKWEIMANYKPTEDINMFMSYVVQNPYTTHSVYSMGSNFTEIQGGGNFDRDYTSFVQNIRFGFGIPLMPDRKLRAEYEFFFDFQAGYLRQQQLKIIKKLHCWEAAIELSQNQRRDVGAERELNYTAMMTFTLMGMQTPVQKINRKELTMFGQKY